MCHEEYELYKYRSGCPSTTKITKTTKCKKPGSDACKKQKNNATCVGTKEADKCGACTNCDFGRRQNQIQKPLQRAEKVS